MGFSSEACPREPNRPPGVGALHQPPPCLPARPLRQRDAALHRGLQASVLHQDRDIPLDDGLVDKVDLAADPVVEFGGAGIPRPVGEHGLRPAVRLRCPDDGHDLDPAAAIPERLPEFAVRRAPGAESRRCLVARIEVDENGAPGVQRDRQPEREVAPEVPGRSPVDPLRQERALDAERLEGGHLIVTAEWDPSTDTVRVEIDPAVPTTSKCFLCLRDLMIPMQGEDRRWEGSPDGALATHQTPVGFVRIESPDGTIESSSAHWIESPHELREVLAGRDFRSTLSGLLEQESKEADYRLAHELGRIGLELIRDSAAYPDLRISGKRRKSNEDFEPRMIDPSTLIASLASCENEAGPLGSGAHSGFGISGVFRAIFSGLDQGHDETEVIDDEGSPGAPEPPEIPPHRLGRPVRQTTGQGRFSRST